MGRPENKSYQCTKRNAVYQVGQRLTHQNKATNEVKQIICAGFVRYVETRRMANISSCTRRLTFHTVQYFIFADKT